MATAAALAAVTFLATAASAHLAAPLVPTALVEEVQSTTAEVEFMDYVGAGQVIKLKPLEVLVLSYLQSCERETITGGTVTVGTERSEVQDGKIARSKVACDGGKIQLASQEASTSAATAFRLQGAGSPATLYARSPMIKIPRLEPGERHLLVIERTDRPGQRLAINIDGDLAGGGYYDLAKTHTLLTPGATYSASIGDRKIVFKVDARAKSGNAPIVSRLLRFQLN